MGGKSVGIPTSYTFGTTVSGGLDLDLDNIKITAFPEKALKTESTIAGGLDLGLDDIRIKEFPATPLKTDSKMDLGLDDIRIKELPRIDLNTQVSVKPTRVHLPMNYKLSLGVMGVELFAVNLCGEGMAIIEDYQQHETEGCR